MSEEIPQIQLIERASYLYDAYQISIKIVGSPSNSHRILSVENLRGLDRLVSNEGSYLAVANSLSSMNHDLGDFQRSMEETIEYIIKSIRGRFNGRSEAEIQSVGAILGLIPYGSSGQGQGKVSGDINLGVYDFEKLINTVPSNHQWLKDFLGQYVTEINEALASVEAGELNARLKVEIDRMNNAIKDCYQEENVTRLKFACQNLSGGYRHVREMMFPTNSEYPKQDDFLSDSRDYVDSLKQLIKFAQGKEKVGFRNYDRRYCVYPKLVEFRNETPRTDETPRPKRKGFLIRFLS